MWIVALIVATLGGVLAWLGKSWLAGFRQGGYDEARAEEARRDLEAARRQSEIMGQQRTGDDVDSRFDDGTF